MLQRSNILSANYNILIELFDSRNYHPAVDKKYGRHFEICGSVRKIEPAEKRILISHISQCANSEGTVKGNCIVKVVPEPFAHSATIVPLCRCTI